MKTYPLPGQTKFEAHLTDEQARFVADEHYVVKGLEKCSDSTGNYHAVLAGSGYVACIGLIGGKPMILHKMPDGTRELEPATLP